MNSRVAGEVGRLLVTAELLRHGFGVARPECDDGFDLISVKRASTRRIQVKTVSTTQGKKPRPSEEFAIRRLRCRKGREKKTEDKCKYTADEIDAFVFVSLVTSNFWVVPIAEINLHGHSLSMRPENRWHEAWHLLEEDSDAA